jgi:hypothetical protein
LWKLRYRQLLELHQACLSKVELEQHMGTELQWHLGLHLNFRFKLTRKILYQQTQMINN